MIALVRLSQLHGLVGVVLLVALPIASWVFGAGYFSWTMYSGSAEYRLDFRVQDSDGRWRTIAPTGLASSATEATADVLVGADHFRRGPSLTLVRTHLGELASFACRERNGALAEVVLRQRLDAESPELVTTARARCR